MRPVAQGAVDFIVFAQDPSGGGWRYQPRTPGDTSVVGWQLQALASASEAKLSFPRQTIASADNFLDSVRRDAGFTYAYKADSPTAAPTISLVGLFSRTCTRGKKQQAEFRKAVDGALGRGPTTVSDSNIYFDYYGTLLGHSVAGRSTAAWDQAMSEKLGSSQGPDGPNAGSWYFKDAFGAQLGRLGITCLGLMILAQTDGKP